MRSLIIVLLLAVALRLSYAGILPSAGYVDHDDLKVASLPSILPSIAVLAHSQEVAFSHTSKSETHLVKCATPSCDKDTSTQSLPASGHNDLTFVEQRLLALVADNASLSTQILDASQVTRDLASVVQRIDKPSTAVALTGQSYAVFAVVNSDGLSLYTCVDATCTGTMQVALGEQGTPSISDLQVLLRADSAIPLVLYGNSAGEVHMVLCHAYACAEYDIAATGTPDVLSHASLALGGLNRTTPVFAACDHASAIVFYSCLDDLCTDGVLERQNITAGMESVLVVRKNGLPLLAIRSANDELSLYACNEWNCLTGVSTPLDSPIAGGFAMSLAGSDQNLPFIVYYAYANDQLTLRSFSGTVTFRQNSRRAVEESFSVVKGDYFETHIPLISASEELTSIYAESLALSVTLESGLELSSSWLQLNGTLLYGTPLLEGQLVVQVSVSDSQSRFVVYSATITVKPTNTNDRNNSNGGDEKCPTGFHGADCTCDAPAPWASASCQTGVWVVDGHMVNRGLMQLGTAKCVVTGNFTQTENATLRVQVSTASAGFISVQGCVLARGNLELDIQRPIEGSELFPIFGSECLDSAFASVRPELNYEHSKCAEASSKQELESQTRFSVLVEVSSECESSSKVYIIVAVCVIVAVVACGVLVGTVFMLRRRRRWIWARNNLRAITTEKKPDEL